MRNAPRFTEIALPLLVLALLASGCAKKKPIAEPAPPPAPAPQETPAPPPPPPPPAPPEETPKTNVQDQLKDVSFDFDSATLTAAAQAILDADGKVLQDRADAKITIEGHCDERGTEEYNLALGDRRAGAAKDYLVRFGIATDRITTISYGKDRPFAEGHDESAWAQNRRAHLITR